MSPMGGTINFQWDRVPQRNRFLVFVILLIYGQKKICSNVLIQGNFWNVNVVLNLQNLSKTMISIWIHRFPLISGFPLFSQIFENQISQTWKVFIGYRIVFTIWRSFWISLWLHPCLFIEQKFFQFKTG
jgi:hypothetical protein